ncbi:MAG: hypothetical protein ACSW8D_11020 [Prevotella sp.]
MTRAQQAEIATKLQNILGSDYEVRFDDLDSGLTRCFYKGRLYKQVENDKMWGGLNVSEFSAPTSLKIEMRYC